MRDCEHVSCPWLEQKLRFCHLKEQLFTVSPRDVLFKNSASLSASGSLDGGQEEEHEAVRKHFPAAWAASLTLTFTFVGEQVRAFSGGYRDCAGPRLTPPFPKSTFQQAAHSRPGGTGHRGQAEGVWLEVKGCRVNKQMDSVCPDWRPAFPRVLRAPLLCPGRASHSQAHLLRHCEQAVTQPVSSFRTVRGA